MGILEEAIREHLDLKRSRGADPSEVARQEREALSPAVREPEAAVVPAAAAEAAEPADAEPADAAPVATSPAAQPEPPEEEYDDATRVMPPSEPLTPRRDDHGQPTEAIDTDSLFDQDDRPSRPAATPTPPSADDLADDIFADPKPPEPEPDPLEETPDFLQETPEHDRLWFEQKPPKDFDFDD
jgi:hypothetical protein